MMKGITVTQLQALERLFETEQPGRIADTLLEAREQLVRYALHDDERCGPATDVADQINMIQQVARVLRAFETIHKH